MALFYYVGCCTHVVLKVNALSRLKILMPTLNQLIDKTHLLKQHLILSRFNKCLTQALHRTSALLY